MHEDVLCKVTNYLISYKTKKIKVIKKKILNNNQLSLADKVKLFKLLRNVGTMVLLPQRIKFYSLYPDVTEWFYDHSQKRYVFHYYFQLQFLDKMKTFFTALCIERSRACSNIKPFFCPLCQIIL